MLFWFLIGYIVIRIIKGYQRERQLERTGEHPGGRADGTTGNEAFRDPVCGVYVAEDDAVIGKLDGKRIHFCSMACLDRYREQIAHK